MGAKQEENRLVYQIVMLVLAVSRIVELEEQTTLYSPKELENYSHQQCHYTSFQEYCCHQ